MSRTETRSVSYQLVVEVAQPLQLSVGRLGQFRVPAGRYVYTGSARRGLEARIARHLRPVKRLRWHIDYLLAASGVRVVRVVRSRRDECALNKAAPGRVLVLGFGASDYSARPGPRPSGPPAAVQKSFPRFLCRAGCGAHLKYAGRKR